MADGRIAKGRFRDVDVVPLEHIFQTCTFCSSPCTGSTENVLCNIVQHDFMLGFHDFSQYVASVFEVSHTSTFRMTIVRNVESSMPGLTGGRMFAMFCHARRQSLSHS